MSGTPARSPIRPLPARFAGRYHVRGPVLRGVDRSLIDQYGRSARDELVGQMPEQYASDFRNDSINALVSYELEALDAYMELATLRLLHTTPKWRELGRHAAGHELESALRTATRPTPDLEAAVRRGVLVWSRLLGFGKWRVATSVGRVSLYVAEIDPASLPLRLWIVGLMEETMRRAVRPDTKLTITLGEMGFTPDLACEIV
jgi:serine/threonine-protein kinase